MFIGSWQTDILTVLANSQFSFQPIRSFMNARKAARGTERPKLNSPFNEFFFVEPQKLTSQMASYSISAV
jgi:hypothetical protein